MKRDDLKNNWGRIELERFEKSLGSIGGLEYYDVIVEDLNGHLQKKFIRLDKSYFVSYFNEIFNNENSSYVSYLSNETIRSGAVPSHLSVLIKKIQRNNLNESLTESHFYSEAVCPEILNFFNVPTVYNEILSEGQNKYVLSIDFIKKDTVFFNAADIESKLEFASTLFAQNIDEFRIKIKSLADEILSIYGKKPQYDLKKLEEDFVYISFVRKYLLSDLDMRAKNFGWIYDIEKNMIYTGPAFDFEMGFVREFGTKSIDVRNNISFFAEKYPNACLKFIGYLDSFVSGKENFVLNKIVDNRIKNRSIAENVKNKLIYNAQIFRKVYDEYCNDKLKSF